jgi:hypothetical protein
MPRTSKVATPSCGQAAAPYDAVEVPEPVMVVVGWADHFRLASDHEPVIREARIALPLQLPVAKFDRVSCAELITALAGMLASAE